MYILLNVKKNSINIDDIDDFELKTFGKNTCM